MFLFWVFDYPGAFQSLSDPEKALVFVDGGVQPLDTGTTVLYPYSPGIKGWAWAASFI
ncbi:hypothetical protein HC928_15225 [bacterium]|nr:hypothetical protein [bacterium]